MTVEARPTTGRILVCGTVIRRFRDGRSAKSRGELDSAGRWRRLTAPPA